MIGTYICYLCGWSGDNPDIEGHPEHSVIVDGHWKKFQEETHYLCPDCKNIFQIIPRGETP